MGDLPHAFGSNVELDQLTFKELRNQALGARSTFGFFVQLLYRPAGSP